MRSGKILVAEHDGSFVIKLVGDVRLTLCTTIDDFYDRMFSAPSFFSVVIDLTDAIGIDSTSLGLLAKLSIRSKKEFDLTPAIISTNPDITRLIQSMGFDKVFKIHQEPVRNETLGELPLVPSNEDSMRTKVIEAHKILMGLNSQNQAKFSDLMVALESSRPH